MADMQNKPLIYDLSLAELAVELNTWGEPNYRAAQIWNGLYRSLWSQWGDFTTLSQALRERLAEQYSFTHLEQTATQESQDGETVKTLFHLPDSQAVEAVLMGYHKRRTLCISTQAGCAMGCVFCATGQMGFRRNLTGGEIVEQVMYYARLLRAKDEQVTNIVFMGMGEPFHNYDATMSAIDRLNQPEGFNFGARRFTISTVGLVPAIRRFTKERRQVNLAISLHAANDELRSSMLPVNKRYPLVELMKACRDYVSKTGRRITFEWALIYDTNDMPEHAMQLVHLVEGLLCHVNVIPLNPTRRYAGKSASRERVNEFKNTLERHGISCTVRSRRGIDIQAGCGQLATLQD
jgi:23S rRNA (adenine2503-C2)-methyltransferase